MIKTTVVIPNWNGMEYLPGCLASLREQTDPDFRILLIDNGSQDGSVEFVRRAYPEVRIRAFRKNTGFAHAVNEGIRLSTTPYVLLLNNDTVCAPDFVAEMRAGMQRHPKAFSGSARMMQMQNPGRIDGAGDYYCALGWAFADGKDLEAHQRGKEHPVFSACGGAAIYRREWMEQVGLFDEAHFAYLEDVDLGYRAKLAGFENWYFPKAEVLHAGSGASGSRYNAFKTRLSSRNSVYLILKNMPGWQIGLNLPLLMAGFGAKNVFFSQKGFGGIYRKGLRQGLRMGIAWRRDRNKGRGEGCLWRKNRARVWKIQAELWRNTLRRLTGR